MAGLAALLLAVCGCSRSSSDKPSELPVENGKKTGAGEGGEDSGSEEESAPMAGLESDAEVVKKNYAAEFKIDPGDVKVRVEDTVEVPGVIVFTASLDPKKAGRNVHRSGVVQDGKIYSELDAMSRVIKAWGYGEERTVPATDFAYVMGKLHSATHGTSAITDADTLDLFKSSAYPNQAAAAKLPEETEVEGAPAVEYCINSGARSIPFTVVTAIVKPDSTVELRKKPIMNE